MNVIEVLNEVLVIACQYFMMIFACDIKTEQQRADLGYDFSILVIIQFVASFLALITAKIVKAWPSLKSAYYKIKEKLCNRNSKKVPSTDDDFSKIDQLS
jgi:ABC-type transport system involved in cytochrome bd biosynthesis fused ATPase/permease subunit